MTNEPYTALLAPGERPPYEVAPIPGSYVERLNNGVAVAGDLLRGRHESLERTVGGIGALLAERRRLSEDVLAGIDQDDLELSNLMLRMYRPNVAPTDNPAYAKLKVEQMRLGRERRQELVSCWRDTALLDKDLVELVEKAQEAQRTSRFLGGGGS